MRNAKRFFKVLVVLIPILALIAFGAAVGARKWANSGASQSPQKNRLQSVDNLPPVVSDIKGIEVISSFIDSNGIANITVVNKTGKAIIGLGLASGKMTFTDDNATAQDNPKPLVGREGSYTFEIPVADLPPNQPIRVSVVFYDDGTEEGDSAQRQNTHDERAIQKEKRSH